LSLVLCHGEKGGVGKSIVAATYCEYVLSKGHKLVLVDGDLANPDVARYFKGEERVQAHIIDLRDETDRMLLLDLLNDEGANDMVVSLPADMRMPFLSAVAPEVTRAVRDGKRTGAMIWVLGRLVTSVTGLKEAMAAVAPSMRAVAVRNLYHTGGVAAKFGRWESSKTRTALLESGGCEMAFPELLDDVFDGSFGATPPVRFTNGIPRYAHRQKLEAWLEQAFVSFDAIAGTLGTGVR